MHIAFEKDGYEMEKTKHYLVPKHVSTLVASDTQQRERILLDQFDYFLSVE